MPPVIKKGFESIGLSEKEVAVLLVLLQEGPLFVSQIATSAKLNRTTTYGLLHDLSEAGLVSSITKKGGAVRYQAIAPEMLPGFIERRQEELGATKREIEQALPQLLLLQKKGKILPKVQYFQGKKGVEQAYEDMIEHNSSKMIYALTGLEGAMSALDMKIQNYFIGKRARLGIKADYVVPETTVARQATEDDAEKLRYARFIPPQYNFNSEICIYDNKVSVLSYALENPIALIIEDETIAHAMKQIFKYVWESAKKG